MGKIFILSLVFFSSLSYAGRVDRYDYQVQNYQEADPKSSLKEFKVTTNKYKVIFSEDESPSFGTTMYAEYTTKEVDQLDQYAVVQYIKGCIFDSKVLADGTLQKTNFVSRQFFGDVVRFMHKDWVIDSFDVDPIYNSTKKHRHGAYRWNEVQGSYAKATEQWYVNQEPDNPTLYVKDMPSGAFTSGDSAKNVSLQFEVCLIKTKDIPAVGTPSLELRDKAIKCFDWDSSFIYNHQKQTYESKPTIDPFCS